MGGDLLEVAEISFFELDKLFTKSAQALRRKLRRKRQRERGGNAHRDGDSDRSRSPPKYGRKKPHNFGGFTGKVEKVEKTVVVTGVPPSVDELLLFKHFSRCGVVADIRIVRNKHDVVTGVVIVEFDQDEGVARSCALPAPHNEILGTAVTVKRADAQIQKGMPAPKRTALTRQQFTQQVLSGLKTGANTDNVAMRKLHIKNLRSVVTEEDMRGIFKPFGDFDAFEMGTQECWITFKNHNDAQDATSSMQGFQLVGQELQITILAAPPPPSLPPAATTLPPRKSEEPLNLAADTDFGGHGGAMATRLDLMKKLMTSHQQGGIPMVVSDMNTAPSAAAGSNAVPPTPKPGGPASRTLLLQNMFTPTGVNLSKDPRFYDEIREDTHDECMKFGKVLHVTVDPRGSSGLIYVLYEAPSQRLAAEQALNGRWFEGKKIIAQGIDDSIWQALAAQAAGGASASAPS